MSAAAAPLQSAAAGGESAEGTAVHKGRRPSLRSLGSQGLQVSQIGMGCMGMTAFYGSFDRAQQEPENLRVIERALQLGVNFFDTAWIYQSFGMGSAPASAAQGGTAAGSEALPATTTNFTNEELLGKAIAIHGRERFIIATKFGIIPPTASSPLRTCGKEETIRSQLADSLSRLGVDCIDLYYMHRMDATTPIEETMRVLKTLVTEGKIRYVGLSECTPSELRRAHAVHPITAIQMEWSVHTRGIEAEVVPVARELGVGIVCYSPLGRGLLSGKLTSTDQLDDGDWRKTHPRFTGQNMDANVTTKAAFFRAAKEKFHCTPAQLALAWLFAQGADVFPIPGTKNMTRLEENVASVEVVLTPQEAAEVAAMVPPAVGERYIGSNFTYEERV